MPLIAEHEVALSGTMLDLIWHESGAAIDPSPKFGGADVLVYYAERLGPRKPSREWAYRLLHHILIDLRHVGHDGLRLGRRACSACGSFHGKPVLSTVPGVSFSLSRRGRGLLAAVGSGIEVGVDLEELRSDWTSGEEAFVLSAGERARMAPEESRADFLTRQWTRKEAYLKGTGEGLNVEMSSVDLRRRTDHVRSVVGDRDGWFVHDLELDVPGYVGAVATGPMNPRAICGPDQPGCQVGAMVPPRQSPQP